MNKTARINTMPGELIFAYQYGVHQLISSRQSLAGYTPQPLEHTTIVTLLEAARRAPSFYDSQPWWFIVIEDGPSRDEIDRDLEEWGADWAVTAPLLIGIVADLSQGIGHCGLNYAHFDCGAAMQNILLQANSMGLRAHPVVCNDRRKIERVLSLPPEIEFMVFVAVGYPSEDTANTNSRRFRRPLHDIARWDTWEGPQVLAVD